MRLQYWPAGIMLLEAPFLLGFIGYQNVSVAITGRTTVDVGLQSAYVALQEVVITAFATDALTGVNERDRASSAVKVDMSAVSTISATSAMME